VTPEINHEAISKEAGKNRILYPTEVFVREGDLTLIKILLIFVKKSLMKKK